MGYRVVGRVRTTGMTSDIDIRMGINYRPSAAATYYCFNLLCRDMLCFQKPFFAEIEVVPERPAISNILPGPFSDLRSIPVLCGTNHANYMGIQ